MDRLVVAALWAACALSAQTANPLSTELVRSYDRIKGFLVTMAGKMPAEDYGFQATPDVETFARRVAHIANANYRTCAGIKGENKSLGAKGSKAELVKALKDSFEYCDGVFHSLTDEVALQMVDGRISSPPLAPGEKQSRLSTLWNVVRHSNEMYGYMSVYLRLKGIVPPSSE